MNKAQNTYWLRDQPRAQRARTETFPQPFPALAAANLGRILTHDELRRWLELIPSRIVFGMILLAALGICATVIERSRAELRASSLQYQRTASEIDTLRRLNSSLEVEIHRMTSDPGMIESVARSRLSMVRPSDIVVPIQSDQAVSDLRRVSFVR